MPPSPKRADTPAEPRPGRLSRRRLALFGCAALLALAAALHAPLLTAAARVLVVDQSGTPATHLVLLGGDSRHDRAAAFLRENPAGRILLIEEVPDALVEHGVVPAAHVLDRRALAERGVPERAIEQLGSPAANDWQAMRRLGRWLADHPDARVAVLCDRFASRRLRIVVDAVLPPDAARRVSLRPLANHQYDETNWWRGRVGARQFVYAWLHLAYQRLRGEPPPRPATWDPDRYEAEIGGRRSEVGGRGSEILATSNQQPATP